MSMSNVTLTVDTATQLMHQVSHVMDNPASISDAKTLRSFVETLDPKTTALFPVDNKQVKERTVDSMVDACIDSVLTQWGKAGDTPREEFEDRLMKFSQTLTYLVTPLKIHSYTWNSYARLKNLESCNDDDPRHKLMVKAARTVLGTGTPVQLGQYNPEERDHRKYAASQLPSNRRFMDQFDSLVNEALKL